MKLKYFYKYFFFRNHLHYTNFASIDSKKKLKKNSFSEVLPNFYINKNEFYLRNIYSGGSNSSFRYLFGLPINGQRTWSNAKTVHNMSRALYNMKYNKFCKFYKIKVSHKLFVCEYVNLFHYYQWFFEWFISLRSIRRFPRYILRSNFIDIANTDLHNVYSHYKSPFKNKKMKSHRKKRVYSKNKISMGLPFPMSFYYRRQLKSNILN